MALKVEQREILRVTVLNFLAIRHVAAFNAEQIASRLRVERALDFRFEEDDVAAACDLLVKTGRADKIFESDIGVTPHYQATGKGVTESERWRAERGLS